MYLRFVVAKKNEDSGQRLGLFNAAYELRRAGELHDYVEAGLKELSDWFGKHLKVPKKFSRSSRHNPKAKAISWYKDSAKECISRMFDLKSILESHGVAVEVIHTDNPGYLVYQDENQITAEPFKSMDA